MLTFRRLLLASVVCLAGCGAKTFDSVAVEQVAPAPTEQVKAVLQGVVQSGELGSGTMELRPLIEQIKATDAAKGDRLLADLTQLEGMAGNPGAAKAKAQEMIGKL